MNKNSNFVSIDVIANNIYKNPLLKDLNFEDIIDYTVSVLKILRMSDIYETNACYVDIKNHKGYVKAPFLNIKTVDKVVNNELIPLVDSNAHSKYHNRDKKNSNINSMSYSVNNRMIHTSFKEGKVFVTFDSLILDEDNLPMIPNSEALIRAIQSYIKSEVYSVLFDLGKIPKQSLDTARQDYFFCIGQASSEYKDFNNVDDMESFIREWKRPVQMENNHGNRDNFTNMREYVKII